MIKRQDLFNKLHYFLHKLYHVFLFYFSNLVFLRQSFMWPRMCMIYALAAKHEFPLDNTWPCSIFIGQLPPRKDYLLRQSVSQDSIIYLNSSSMKWPLASIYYCVTPSSSSFPSFSLYQISPSLLWRKDCFSSCGLINIVLYIQIIYVSLSYLSSLYFVFPNLTPKAEIQDSLNSPVLVPRHSTKCK